MTELEPIAHGELLPVAPQRRDQNPYWVYLHSLDGGTSFNTMKGCLDHIGKMLAPELDRDPGEHIPWGDLRFQHTAMLRSRLMNTATSFRRSSRGLASRGRTSSEQEPGSLCPGSLRLS